MALKSRQICFILIFYTVAAKLLQYPTMLSEYSGNDLVLSSLISFAVQGAVIWAIAYLASKTDKTFFGLIEGALGKIAARIVYGFFAAFFLFITILPLFEHKLYVNAIFYDTPPSAFVFLPVFFFTVYAGAKSLENVGRCADVCLPIFVLCLVPLILMAFSEVDYTNLLPVAGEPVSRIFRGVSKTSAYFAEPAYLLMFLGNFRYKKGDAARITLSYAAGALIVMFFLATFYGVYGGISSSRQFAVSKTSLYFSAIDMIGRIDLFILYVFEVIMLFALVLNIQLAVRCIVAASGWDYPEIISLAVNVCLAVILYVCNHYYMRIQTFFSDWAWIAVALFCVALPLAAWALKRRDYD